jgi:ketosteroid isomerase-like protein
MPRSQNRLLLQQREYADAMDAQFTTRLLDRLRDAPDRKRGVLAEVYGAIIRGDFERYGSFLADDVELVIRGCARMAGHWRGRDEVVEATRRNFGQLEGQKPEVDSMIADGDVVAVLIQETGVFRQDKRSYRYRCAQWFTFEGDRIRRIEEIVADA